MSKISTADMSVEELEEKVKSLKSDLFTQRFQKATGRLEDTSVIKDTKANIARCLGAITQKNRQAD